jgi:hypothetical protein
MPKITAFVARSFDPEDERKIEPILNFLESFRANGFLAETAERADVESVSKKVRDLIDASNVFVGIFTRRYPVYDRELLTRKDIFHVLSGLKVERWVAPPWVIQESGYALKAILAKKKMVLFRERGVELPSLQGDLEYIEFAADDFLPALQKASEMINGLLSEASGTVVETVVRSAQPSPEASVDAAPAQLEKPPEPPAGFGHYFHEMREAIGAKEWDRAKRAYESGLALLVEEDASLKIYLEATYHQLRYFAGQDDGFAALKKLAEENPNHADPLQVISDCFYHFQEYQKSADYALQAARLAHGDDALDHLFYAAKALEKAKKPEEALKLIMGACRGIDSYGASRLRLRKELYALLKNNKDPYVAFAVAEWTLQENPGASEFRFSISYDYDDKGFHDLSLFHYRILRENDPKNEAVLNNLGVSYSNLNLPIHSVDSYEEAYRNGNTLAADNLAHGYLTGGFASDAMTLINEAMKQENYEAKLPGTLAKVNENRKEEEVLEKSSLENAEKHRRFLSEFGEGFLQNIPPLNGTWKFPDADISLSMADGVLQGETKLTVDRSHSLYPVLLGPPQEARQDQRTIGFSGQVEGRTCKFRVETETLPIGQPRHIGVLLAGGRIAREGHIVFSHDGNSGQACELKNGKPSEFYSITKAM